MKGSAALKREAKDQDSWRGFRRGDWSTSIDVRDFIVRNVTPYAGDEKFLAGASKRTKAVWAKLQPYFQEERKKGVLAVDAKNPSTMLAHKAGYIDQDNEVIVGLQTDEPFKRAIFPFGGLRMVEAGLKAAGFAAEPQVGHRHWPSRRLRAWAHHRRLSAGRPLRSRSPSRGQARRARPDG